MKCFLRVPAVWPGPKTVFRPVVLNSPRLAEIESVNKVHRCYNPNRRKDLNHYIFWFYDSTFECIAKSYSVEVFQESMRERGQAGFPLIPIRTPAGQLAASGVPVQQLCPVLRVSWG